MNLGDQADLKQLTEQMRYFSITDLKERRKIIFRQNRQKRGKLKTFESDEESKAIEQSSMGSQMVGEKILNLEQSSIHGQYNSQRQQAYEKQFGLNYTSIQAIFNNYCQQSSAQKINNSHLQHQFPSESIELDKQVHQIIFSIIRNFNNLGVIFKEDIKVIMDDLELRPLCSSRIYVKVLGILACRRVDFRNYIFSIGGAFRLAKIAMHVYNQEDILGLSQLCWTMCALCSGDPTPPIEEVQPILPVFCILLALDKIKDEDIYLNCLYAIALYITQQTQQPIISSQLLKIIIPQCLKKDSKTSVIEATLLIINKFIEGGNDCLSYVIKNKLDKLLEKCLEMSTKIKRKACQILSYISTRQTHFIELMQNEKLPKTIIKIFNTEPNQIKSEFCKVMMQFASTKCLHLFFESLIQQNLFAGFEALCQSNNPIYIRLSLEVLCVILKEGQQYWMRDGNPWSMRDIRTMSERFQHLGWKRMLNGLEDNYQILSNVFDLVEQMRIALGEYTLKQSFRCIQEQ